MFVLPRKLNFGDKVDIKGTLKSNCKFMSVNLMTGNTSPDYQNIACQFEAHFPNEENNTDQIIIKVIQNGVQEIVPNSDGEIRATHNFTDAKFTFSIAFRLGKLTDEDIPKPVIEIIIGNSSLQELEVKHNLESVRFLMLNGDIEKVHSLDFKFS